MTIVPAAQRAIVVIVAIVAITAEVTVGIAPTTVVVFGVAVTAEPLGIHNSKFFRRVIISMLIACEKNNTTFI